MPKRQRSKGQLRDFPLPPLTAPPMGRRRAANHRLPGIDPHRSRRGLTGGGGTSEAAEARPSPEAQGRATPEKGRATPENGPPANGSCAVDSGAAACAQENPHRLSALTPAAYRVRPRHDWAPLDEADEKPAEEDKPAGKAPRQTSARRSSGGPAFGPVAHGAQPASRRGRPPREPRIAPRHISGGERQSPGANSSRSSARTNFARRTTPDILRRIPPPRRPHVPASELKSAVRAVSRRT